jgi:hypothetical protein
MSLCSTEDVEAPTCSVGKRSMLSCSRDSSRSTDGGSTSGLHATCSHAPICKIKQTNNRRCYHNDSTATAPTQTVLL